MDRPDESPQMQRAEANWMQVKGYLREKWGELTDDDLDRLEGRREQLAGYLEERTAARREEIERTLDDVTRRAHYAW